LYLEEGAARKKVRRKKVRKNVRRKNLMPFSTTAT
jgi:hypothetical protein